MTLVLLAPEEQALHHKEVLLDRRNGLRAEVDAGGLVAAS